jgi:hypothetical protein
MCGRKLKSFLLLLALLSLPLSLVWSQDAAGQTEEELLLNECVTRLEVTTNELERSIELNEAWNTWSVSQSDLLQNAMNLNRELLTARQQDAERFREIEISFDAYVARESRRAIRNTVIGVSVGVPIGVLLTTGVQKWLDR